MKKILAIDFDGVIANSDELKEDYAKSALGLNIKQKDLKRWYFIEKFGEEKGSSLYSQIISNVYASQRMLTDLKLMPFVKESIAALNENNIKCYIVTSRHGSINEKGSMAWWAWRYIIQNNLMINERQFINTNDLPKHDVCLNLKAFGLVDDDYQKLIPVINAGLQGFLFSTNTNKYAEKEHKDFNAIRIDDWNHLVTLIKHL